VGAHVALQRARLRRGKGAPRLLARKGALPRVDARVHNKRVRVSRSVATDPARV
jgi:hypothetical protein